MSRLKALPADRLDRIARPYQRRLTPARAPKQMFWGRFEGKTPNDLPDLVDGLLRALSRGEEPAFTPVVRRAVARKMGISDSAALATSFAFLADDKAVQASWEEYGRGTREYRDARDAYEKARRKDPKAKEPEQGSPFEGVYALVGDLNLFDFSFASNDELVVRLQCPVKPLATNGEWDDRSGRVSWSTTLRPVDPKDPDPPKICYAS
jgi:hypothetical protein